MRLHGFRVRPKSNVECPYQRQKRRNRETQREIHVKTEVDIEVMHLQDKECEGLPDPPEARREAWN